MKWNEKKGEYIIEKWEYVYGTYFYGSLLLTLIFMFINVFIALGILIPAFISFQCVKMQ